MTIVDSTFVHYRHYVCAMDGQSQQEVIESIRDLYTWFEVGTSDEGILAMLTRTENTVCNRIVIDNHVVAFMISRVERVGRVRVFYISGILIEEEYRAKGIFKDLLLKEIQCSGIRNLWYIAAKTQNPAIYLGLVNLFGEENVFPRPIFTPSNEMLTIAKHFCPEQEDIDSKLIIRDIYENIREERNYLNPLYRTEVGAYFFDTLKFNDAFFVIASYKPDE